MECCYECPLVQVQTGQTVGDTTAAESHVIHTVWPLGFGRPVNFLHVDLPTANIVAPPISARADLIWRELPHPRTYRCGSRGIFSCLGAKVLLRASLHRSVNLCFQVCKCCQCQSAW